MNYELAKELKDAGFPQEPSGEVSELFGDERHSDYILWKQDACSPTVVAGTAEYQAGIERGDVLVKIPTLQELIDACGDEIVLEKISYNELNSWRAGTFIDYDGNIKNRQEANTHIEAVARLWLALNKK